jgi:2-aminoethylphosphonate-pyruvate transaminase
MRQRVKKDHYLFCPGPVMVSEQVRKALLRPDMAHRVPAFEKVMQNLEQNLLKIYKADDSYTVLLITGSGTAANETVISSYFTPADEVLLINNGEFGCRLEELFQIHEVKTTVLNCEWGEAPRVSDIEKYLIDNPGISALVMVYHETSTSVINPVREVGELANRYGKTYFVDGVSAVGGEDVDVVRDHIDFCTCSSNKCLASLPGVGIICAKKSKLEQTKNNKIRVAYLNLYRLYETSRTKHQTPNTPSVTMFIALDAAVERLLDEGLEAQINRHKRCAGIIRNGMKDLGLKVFVDENMASNTVTSVFLPEEVDQDDFITQLEEKGFTVYRGKRHLKAKNIFQIANMGAITEDMCHELLNVMTDTL